MDFLYYLFNLILQFINFIISILLRFLTTEIPFALPGRLESLFFVAKNH